MTCDYSSSGRNNYQYADVLLSEAIYVICTHLRPHGRVVKGVGHLSHEEAMEAGGREFDPRPGHYRRTSF